MKMMRFTLIFILNLLFIVTTLAQNFRFKHLTDKDGLASSRVECILQDSDGFMWFGTINGLSRYDGCSFLNFYHSPTDSQSLSNSFINCLIEDKHKNIWVGTNFGLNRLDLETYKISRFKLFKDNQVITSNSLALNSDSSKLWIGSDNMGLICMDLITNAIVSYKHFAQDSRSISSNKIQSLLNDPKRGLLVGTSTGLDIFDTKSTTCKHLLKGIKISNLSFDRDSSVLIGSFNAGNRYFRLSDGHHIDTLVAPVEDSEREVFAQCDSEGNLWVSLRDNGLVHYDRQENITSRLLYDKNNLSGINSNIITCIYDDRLGDIWISTLDAGINVFQKKRKAFIHVIDNNLSNGLQNNRVRSMYQDSKGDIWIGTKVDGALSKFERESLTFTHFKHHPSDPNSISNDFIFCITEDRPGYLWLGTLNGLNLFNKSTGKTKVWKHSVDNPNGIASNEITALLKDENQLYIGHVIDGLDVFDTPKDTITNYRKSKQLNSISDNRIKVIYKDGKANIWVGTFNGLNLFNKETGNFTRFLNNPSDSTSISDNYIVSIGEDSRGNLWIGTSLGINRLNSEDNTFKVFTTKDGLAGNSVRGIQGDGKGNIWISTDNGLSKFNPETQRFKNYDVNDGLQSNEFSHYVSCKTKNGELLFGGNNGFNIFHPDKIIDNKEIPDVRLTSFKLFNKEVPVGTPGSALQHHINRTDEITLTHKQSVFSFGYVALNYTSSEKNQYAYRLDGFDKEWNYVGNKREAVYTNLDPGQYVFRVKASNNDGYWNEEGTSVRIKILSHPLLSVWAYIIYFVLLVVISLWVGSLWTKRSKQQKEHELDQIKIKFFANVSHEFRTPLTLILAPLEKILKQNKHPEQEDQLRLMRRNAQRLLNLVNQLLDFQKVGAGQLKLENSLGDLVQFTRDLSYSFIELSDEKNIHFVFKSEINECQAMFDYNKMEKIIFNLLSNAFKFTPDHGEISIEISLDKEDEDEVVLEVKDNGVGISASHLNKVFKRFYQVESPDTTTNQGSGIGLALTKEYVELHGGEISVDSSVGVGTCFKVVLPIVGLSGEIHSQTIIENIQESNDEIGSVKQDGNKKVGNRKKLPIILLVEDNSDFRSFLKSNLMPKYKLLEASNGSDGLRLALEHIPDLIISDVMMPEMDGHELCQKIKNDKLTSHIPVILLTAQVSEDHQVAGFDSGADQYVTKPFNFEVLESRIKGLLAQRNKLQSVFSKKLEVNPSEITVTSIDEKLIQKALDLVERNISNPGFSVDELSRELGINRVQLYRKISTITGNSPTEFIRSIRLKRAAQLLKSTKLTVSEICYKVGYNDPKHFSKLFKNEFKMTPTKYIASNISKT